MAEFSVSAHGELVARLQLDSWVGARDASGPYTSSRRPESDGIVEVILLRSSAEPGPPKFPSDQERQCVAFLLENERLIADNILTEIWNAYPAIRQWLRECMPEDELSELLPDVGREGVRDLIGLGSVFVLPLDGEELPYFGFELGCSWDDEHGLGVMFRGVEPISFGDASVAFNVHAPRQDRILRNLVGQLANSQTGSNLTISRRRGLWKYAPWERAPTPDLGVYDATERLVLAIDISDFHWEGSSRWGLHFIQYRNEPSSFVRMTICPSRAEALIWKRTCSENKDWAPIREAKALDAVLRVDEVGTDFALASIYSGVNV